MKRSKSSYYNLRKERNLNESTQRYNQSINFSKELELDNYQSNQIKDGVFSTNNKNYGVNPNEYKSKYKNQLKRKKMFNELWHKNTNGKDSLGLLDTIKVQNKYKKNYYNNIIGDLKGVIKKKRIASAGTFCNIPIKGNNKISFNKLNSKNTSININSLTKNKSINVSSKININSDINTNNNSNNIINSTKDKTKFSNEFNIIFQNQEIQNCFLSPIKKKRIMKI